MVTCPLVFTRTSNPYGRTWEIWASLWCKWLLSTPKSQNPSIDNSGENCAVSQTDPYVWFLGGTFGNECTIYRRCNIPLGKAIFFPILEKEDSFAEDLDLKTEEELATRATNAMDEVKYLEASIDGLKIANIEDYRVRSSFFDLHFPANNVYDVVPGITRSVCDGYWIFLKPLSLGSHQIYFHGECLLLEGESSTKRIMNQPVYAPIKEIAKNSHLFRVKLRYDLMIH